jgi:hypothetical protein
MMRRRYCRACLLASVRPLLTLGAGS